MYILNSMENTESVLWQIVKTYYGILWDKDQFIMLHHTYLNPTWRNVIFIRLTELAKRPIMHMDSIHGISINNINPLLKSIQSEMITI